MIYFEKRSSRGETTASNIPKNLLGPEWRRKEINLPDATSVSFVTNDPDLIKSSRVLKKLALAFNSIHEQFTDQLKAHSHTIKKLQGQLAQKLDGIIESPMLSYADDYPTHRSKVAVMIQNKNELAADTLLYLRKRIIEMDAHIQGFEVLHMGEEIRLDIQQHNIRRILINILHAFNDDFTTQQIHPHFMFDDASAEVSKLALDYKTINAAFYNFLTTQLNMQNLVQRLDSFLAQPT